MATKGFTPATLKLLVRMFVAKLNITPKQDGLSSLSALKEFFAPDFRVSSCASLPCVTGRDFSSGDANWSPTASRTSYDILDTTVEVEDAEIGNSKVWVCSKITGLSGEQEILSLDMPKWRQGLWQNVVMCIDLCSEMCSREETSMLPVCP